MIFSDPNLQEWGEAITYEQLTCLKQSWQEAIPVKVLSVKKRSHYFFVKLLSNAKSPNWLKQGEFVSLGLKEEPDSNLIEGKIIVIDRKFIILQTTHLEIENISFDYEEYWLLPFSSVSYDLMRESIVNVVENDALVAKKILTEKNISTSEINVIQGPPGTGKTTTIGKMCLKLYNQFKAKMDLLSQKNSSIPRILLTAFTHKACVNIAQTLDNLAIPFISVNVNGLPPALHKRYTLNQVVTRAIQEAKIQYPSVDWERHKNTFQRQILDQIMFIICTGMTAPKKFPVKQRAYFNLTIIDEGSQMPIPTLAGVASLSEKLLIFGDPVQLPPVILSSLLESEGEYKINPLTYTIYNRIREQQIELLDKQYRGRPEIFMLVSALFYGGKIRTAKYHSPLFQYPVIEFIDTSSSKPKDYNRVNYHEAEIIQDLLNDLGVRVDTDPSVQKIKVGVISPFRAQAAYLRRILYSSPELELDIGTVHVAQGRTYDVVIFSLAATSVSPFLNPPKSWLINLKKSLENTFQELKDEKSSLMALGYPSYLSNLEKVFTIWTQHLDSFEEIAGSDAVYPDSFVRLRLFDDTGYEFLLNLNSLKHIPENDFAPNIFNVALSRARTRLIVIGEYDVLHHNPLISLVYSWSSVFGNVIRDYEFK